jgi:hypothetical protein
MMTCLTLGIGRYAARCEKHPVASYVTNGSHAVVVAAQRHNAKYHPRRLRRLARGFIS